MKGYVIRTKLPRNPEKRVQELRRAILRRCIQNHMDCVVEYLDGRIILFSSGDITPLITDIKGVLSTEPVKIFEDYNSFLKEVLSGVAGINSFAVRANKKSLEEKLGSDIHTATGISVDLRNPQRIIRVESRGNFFLLYI